MNKLWLLLLVAPLGASALPLHECVGGAWADTSRPNEGFVLNVAPVALSGFFYDVTQDGYITMTVQGEQDDSVEEQILNTLDLFLEGDKVYDAELVFVSYDDIIIQYASEPAVKHYAIPVGEFYTGEFDRMFFIMDNDANLASDAIFSDISVTNQRDSVVNFNSYTAETPLDFSIAPYGTDSNGNPQDKEGIVTVENGGRTLRLRGNTWKRIAFPVIIAATTVLQFDFASNIQGEVHAIGFDIDDNTSGEWAFTVYGTQEWNGIDLHDYDPDCSVWDCRGQFNFTRLTSPIACPEQVEGIFIGVAE